MGRFPGPFPELISETSSLSRSRRPRPDRPQLVSELLPAYLSKKGLAAKLEAASVVPQWEDLVGPQIAAVTTPVRVSEGTLFVTVATSAWMMELNLMKAHLMGRLNAGKKAGRIEQIVFLMAG